MYAARIIVILLCQAAVTFGAGKPPKGGLNGAASDIRSLASALSRLSKINKNLNPTSTSASPLSVPSGSMTITPPPRTAAPSILAAPKSAWDPAGMELAWELSSYFLAPDNGSAAAAAASTDTDTDTDGSATTESCDGVCTTCAYALETFSLCASVSGDAFVSGNADVVATCLCYDWMDDAQTYSWVGPQFDAPYSSCVQYVQTEGSADKDVVSSWASMDGFCGKVSASYWAQHAAAGQTTAAQTAASMAPTSGAGKGGLEGKGAIVSGIFGICGVHARLNGVKLWVAVSIALLGPVLYAF